MAPTNSMLAYMDVQAVMDKAIGLEIGLRINFTKKGEAISFRQRFYKFRALSHKLTMGEGFSEMDAAYGTSPYDTLMIQIKPKEAGEKWVVEVRKRDTIKYNISEIVE